MPGSSPPRTPGGFGVLANLVFPTTADLLSAAWTGWWREHKLPPSPDQLMTCADRAFWDWRDEIMQQHNDHLADLLGDRPLPLFDLISAHAIPSYLMRLRG